LKLQWPLETTRGRRFVMSAAILFCGLLSVVIWREVYSSKIQSQFFSAKASQLKFRLESGPSRSIAFPTSGPFDEMLGYTLIPAISERVTKRGYEIRAQARLSPEHLRLVHGGVIYPIYKEKSQAGLAIDDATGKPLFSALYPQLSYDTFDDIPPAIWRTLLLIENRDLLDKRYPYKNPTLDWSRLFVAILDNIVTKFFPSHDSPGGSTLATQLEKYRHSPDGRTTSARQKLVQMTSASLRAYQDGRNTFEARKRIIKDYVNTVPLGALPGTGEIRGIGHALAAYFGASFAEVTDLLRDIKQKETNAARVLAKAVAYKQILALFLSQRRPAYYLGQDQEALKELVDKHIDVMIRGKALPKRLRQAVAKAELNFRSVGAIFQPERLSYVERKAANAVRVHLLNYFGFDRLYTLDRLDLRVKSTIDYGTQKAVQDVLTKLKDKDYAKSQGLMDQRLLAEGDPKDVIYSFTLRERRHNANLLRVQADNVDGPFNVSEGGKLELGSTAKLRTLVTYLEVIEELWHRYRRLGGVELKEALGKTDKSDQLSRWVITYLLEANGSAAVTLEAILNAALERRYTASPAERFLTSGGIHRFNNFEKSDNGRIVDVKEAVRKSINLPFVRMMRDIVQYFIAQIPGGHAMLEDVTNPNRREFLARFANKEGREYLGRFYLRYRGLSSDQMVQALMARMRLNPRRLAVLYASIAPDTSVNDMAAFIAKYQGAGSKPQSSKQLQSLYKATVESKLSLQDRGYICGVHPLELWLVSYIVRAPKVSFTQVLRASTGARQESYQWLFTAKGKKRQDSRIRIMLEDEAFKQIHEHWAKLGYPFASLVPTYATALGSSGDKPTALAELMGIITSGGVQYVNTRVSSLEFAKDTPFETHFRAKPSFGTRVLSRPLTAAVRDTIKHVVDSGTAVRVRGAFVDTVGKTIPVGGKTGTGDNRYSVFAPGGRIIESRAVSRTATFVFYIGERFFGTITAYVPDASAAKFSFTSALPVQILKILSSKLSPLINAPVTAEE